MILSSSLLAFLGQQASVKRIQVPAGTRVCQSGERCDNLVLVLQGQVKVYRPAINGRSVTLYYVNTNESCILTASCILNELPFPAVAETITEVEALMIPPEKVKQWLEHEARWQKYIFSLLSQRMADLIELVNALAFQALDARLSDWLLLQHASHLDNQHPETIKTTHQLIAEDLASSREVISRLLKEFEVDGIIELGRGSIKIKNKKALEKMAGAM